MSSSYPTRTNAQPIDLNTFVQLPLYTPFMPSSLMIFFQQSIVPLQVVSIIRKIGQDPPLLNVLLFAYIGRPQIALLPVHLVALS